MRRALAVIAVVMIGSGIWLKPFSFIGVSPSTGSDPKKSQSTAPKGSIPGHLHGATSPSNAHSLESLLKQARASLPTRHQLRLSAPGEVHGTPPALMEAGRALGALAEHLHAHPELIPDSLNFYLDCARDPGGVSSVRALCYGNLLRYWSHLSPEQVRLTSEIPEEIQLLWRNLQD